MEAAGVVSKEEGPFSRVAHDQKGKEGVIEVRLRCNFWSVKNESTHHLFSRDEISILKIDVCLILLNMKCGLSREGRRV